MRHLGKLAIFVALALSVPAVLLPLATHAPDPAAPPPAARPGGAASFSGRLAVPDPKATVEALSSATHVVDLPPSAAALSFRLAADAGARVAVVVDDPPGRQAFGRVLADRGEGRIDAARILEGGPGGWTFRLRLVAAEGPVAYSVVLAWEGAPGAVVVRAPAHASPVAPGIAVPVRVRVASTSDAPAGANLTADAPEGWRAETPAATRLDPGERRDVDVLVTAPEDAAEGASAEIVLRLDGAEAARFRVVHDATLARLRERPRAVVALIDTGINPYHVEFRREGRVHPPSSWMPGYPESAKRLDLAFGAANLPLARAADAETWNATENDALHWVAGTNIVGLVHFGGRARFDEDGRGTGAASVLAGATVGACPRCEIVMVSGDPLRGLRWVAEQTWIDAVSVSPGALTEVPLSASLSDVAREAAREGKALFAAAGDNPRVGGVYVPTSTHLASIRGLPWVVRVGAWNETYGQPEAASAQTAEVYAASWATAATFDAFDGYARFGQTSAATPQAAGRYANVLVAAREAARDATGGATGGVVARGRATTMGPLDDGVLTAEEALGAFLRSARPMDVVESHRRHGHEPGWGPTIVPGAPGATWLTQGYGLVDRETDALAQAVARGLAVEPRRGGEDLWRAADRAARTAYAEGQDRFGLDRDQAVAGAARLARPAASPAR